MPSFAVINDVELGSVLCWANELIQQVALSFLVLWPTLSANFPRPTLRKKKKQNYHQVTTGRRAGISGVCSCCLDGDRAALWIAVTFLFWDDVWNHIVANSCVGDYDDLLYSFIPSFINESETFAPQVLHRAWIKFYMSVNDIVLQIWRNKNDLRETR